MGCIYFDRLIKSKMSRHIFLSGAVHVGQLKLSRQESALVRIILAAVWKIFLNTHWNWYNGPVFVLHFVKAS